MAMDSFPSSKCPKSTPQTKDSVSTITEEIGNLPAQMNLNLVSMSDLLINITPGNYLLENTKNANAAVDIATLGQRFIEPFDGYGTGLEDDGEAVENSLVEKVDRLDEGLEAEDEAEDPLSFGPDYVEVGMEHVTTSDYLGRDWEDVIVGPRGSHKSR